MTFSSRLAVAFRIALAGLATFFLISQVRASGNQVTLTGTISDTMCGAKHMISGDDARCVRTCVKSGSQYALVVDDKVYALDGRRDELDQLAGQKAALTGILSNSTLKVTSAKPAQAGALNSSPDGESQVPITTIEGLVRDVACPIQNKEATATKFNLKCAQDCARLGSPLIILTQQGTLYTPLSDTMPDTDQRQRLMPFLGKYVRVTGQVYERAGAHAIAIKGIQELKDVHLITDAE